MISQIIHLFDTHTQPERSIFHVPTQESDSQQTPYLNLLNKHTQLANLPGTEHLSFIWDTGASTTVTHDARDFVGEISPLVVPVIVKGLASGLTIQGKGKVRWMVPAVDGTLRCIELNAFYTPGGTQRFLSRQSYLQTCEATKHTAQGRIVADHIRMIGGGRP